MTNLRRYILSLFAVSLCCLAIPAFATDFGDAKDLKQVRKVVAAKVGHPLHASVSHDWGLCTASSGQSDLSVVLHRSGSDWKIVQSDGGAYVAETLKDLGVPDAEIASLLKAYQ